MSIRWSKMTFYVSSFFACGIMAITSGCASGGFQLTRQYARWVNSQNIIIRIILYILTLVVFAVTLVLDAVVFNTMDFWQGRVSAGSYKFNEGEKTYLVQHDLNGKLRRSTIEILENKKSLQKVVINETQSEEIEVYVDGKLKTKVKNIYSLPIASTFNAKGQWVEDKILWGEADLNNRFLAGR